MKINCVIYWIGIYPLDRDKSTFWTAEGWSPFFEIPEITEPRKVGFPESMELRSVLFFLGTNSKTGNRFHGFWLSQNAKKKTTTNKLTNNNNNNNTLPKVIYLRASYWTQTPISFTILSKYHYYRLKNCTVRFLLFWYLKWSFPCWIE